MANEGRKWFRKEKAAEAKVVVTPLSLNAWLDEGYTEVAVPLPGEGYLGEVFLTKGAGKVTLSASLSGVDRTATIEGKSQTQATGELGWVAPAGSEVLVTGEESRKVGVTIQFYKKRLL